ncbi:MAG: universal stress protein [Prochloraceae cyanobacterium]
MWQKILVAIDLSPIAKKVFEVALTLAKPSCTNLIILHVLSPDEEGAPFSLAYSDEYPLSRIMIEEHHKQWEIFQKKALVELELLKNKAIKNDLNVEVLQFFGSPGATICQQQKINSADLIVIGNRGLSGVKELFFGSVSNYVIHHASSSVFVVKSSIS